LTIAVVLALALVVGWIRRRRRPAVDRPDDVVVVHQAPTE
jgi:hypothetical protein